MSHLYLEHTCGTFTLLGAFQCQLLRGLKKAKIKQPLEPNSRDILQKAACSRFPNILDRGDNVFSKIFTVILSIAQNQIWERVQTKIMKVLEWPSQVE